MGHKPISYIYKGKRSYREISLGKNINDLLRAIDSGNQLAFELTAVTKTQLAIELFTDDIALAVNLKIDGFKLAEKTSYNHFSSQFQTSHYFKLIKSQGKNELEQYLTKVIEEITSSLEIQIPQTEFVVHCNGFNFH